MSTVVIVPGRRGPAQRAAPRPDCECSINVLQAQRDGALSACVAETDGRIREAAPRRTRERGCCSQRGGAHAPSLRHTFARTGLRLRPSRPPYLSSYCPSHAPLRVTDTGTTLPILTKLYPVSVISDVMLLVITPTCTSLRTTSFSRVFCDLSL